MWMQAINAFCIEMAHLRDWLREALREDNENYKRELIVKAICELNYRISEYQYYLNKVTDNDIESVYKNRRG